MHQGFMLLFPGPVLSLVDGFAQNILGKTESSANWRKAIPFIQPHDDDELNFTVS